MTGENPGIDPAKETLSSTSQNEQSILSGAHIDGNLTTGDINQTVNYQSSGSGGVNIGGNVSSTFIVTGSGNHIVIGTQPTAEPNKVLPLLLVPVTGTISTAGFPSHSDPECAAMKAKPGEPDEPEKFIDFCDTLGRQLKLHLLMNEHVLIPGGYFFDNPAIWRILLNEHGFKDLLLSKPNGAEKTTLIIAKHKSGSEQSLDSIFRTWFLGEDLQRINDPSSLRLGQWIFPDEKNHSHTLRLLRKEGNLLGIQRYAIELGLTSFAQILESNCLTEIFKNACWIETPANRHEEFLKRTRELLQSIEVQGIDDLRKLVNESGRRQISRSEILTKAPTAWKELKESLITVRQSCYFGAFEGIGQISPIPNLRSLIKMKKNEIDVIQHYMERWLAQNNYTLSIDDLRFDEILEMRNNKALMVSIRKLGACKGLYAEREIETLKVLNEEWSESLFAAAKDVKRETRKMDDRFKNAMLNIIGKALPSIRNGRNLNIVLWDVNHLIVGLQPKDPRSAIHLIIKSVNESRSSN